MPPPGARGPTGRGAPSPQGTRHAMDRTASLPNLGIAAAGAPPTEESRHHHQQRHHPTSRGSQRSQPTADSPTSPRTSQSRYCAPSQCRPTPVETSATAARHPTARTPENKFSTVSPTTRAKIISAEKRPTAQNPRSNAQQSQNTPTGATNTATKPIIPHARAETSRAPVPPRTHQDSQRTQSVPTATMARVQTTSPAQLLKSNKESTGGTRSTNRDPRINRDSRRQMAPLVMPTATNPDSPAPPRTAAYDSPALRSGQSSISGSSTSLASYGRRAEREAYDTETPNSPTPSMELDFDYQTGGRAPRRRRSPDEEVTEEAKRYCLDPQRTQAQGNPSPNSRTFSEAVRRSPSPGPHLASSNPKPKTPGVGHSSPPTPNTEAAPKNAAEGNTKKKRPRYPPLVVEKLPNWATHFRALATILKRPPNARPYRQGVRFSPESEDEYRVVQRYLTTLEKEEGVSWFAYSLPADKKLKVAIRGLPADTSPQDIEEELRELGYEPEYVRHINARQGRPGCVFHAVLNKTENVRAIYDTSVFMLMRGVKIEAWRGKRGPAQCHRCQQFRHSSHQCHRPLACVRCGEGHTARDCPRPREEPATCKNCGGPHPANNIKCPVFQKEIKHRRAGTVAITTSNSRQPQKAVQKDTQPSEEAQGMSLMAAANGPTQRGEEAHKRRRKGKRGGKGKKPTPQATLEDTPETAPATSGAQAVKNTDAKETISKATTSAGAAQTKRHLADKPETKNTVDQSAGASKTGTANRAKAAPNTQNVSTRKNKDFTTCAIQLLMDLIKAIRQGQDVEQVILDGLAALLTLYHHA